MLADLIRSSMSSPIHELLKREDELAVVIHAHDDPRFVEDCVRALLSSTLDAEALAGLDDATIVRAWQRNHESIHAHDVEAERSTTLGVLRAQLRGA
jgi:MptA/FolE2 family GTP cyclohydrolase